MGKKRRVSGKPYSILAEHTKEGTILKPPLMGIPNPKPEPWLDKRLPEMLWAALLISQLSRNDALNAFRYLLDYCYQLSDESQPADMTLSAFARMPREAFVSALHVLCDTCDTREALRPLLLIPTLPGREVWADVLGSEPDTSHWRTLGKAVADTIDHRSEAATDCRWIRIAYLVLLRRVHFQGEEQSRATLDYPNHGYMPLVYSFIRSSEIALAHIIDEQSQGWAESFWHECMIRTRCVWQSPSAEVSLPPIGTTCERVNTVYQLLVDHCDATRQTTAIDARHDTVFGMAFYILQLLRELMTAGNSVSLLGRMGLRALVECYITLAYLTATDTEELWNTYRNYGSGQAKLAFLKLDSRARFPTYVSKEMLEMLATEDRWLEFQDINVGHWEKTNLRAMSEKAGVKEDYDLYYSWTSGFLHAQWNAVRDSVFDTCWNPLHRLHRIPHSWKIHNDVVDDACIIVDKVLALVERCYPTFSHRVRVECD